MKKATLILFLLFGQTVSAQENLSLDQIIQKVKSYNQDLKLKNIETKSVQLEKRSAIGTALPQVSANIGYNFNFSVPSFDIPGQGRFQMQGDKTLEYGAQIKQALFTFGAIRSALRAAESGMEANKYDIRATEENVEYLAKDVYYRFLLAKRNLEINEDLLKNAEDNYKILRGNFSGGRAPQGDVIRLQADIEAKKPLVENAKAQLKSVMIDLNILMGNDPNTEIVINGQLRSKFPILSGPVLQNDLFKGAPALKVIEKNIQLSNDMADVQWSNQMPKLNLVYNFNQANQIYDSNLMQEQKLKTSMLGVVLSWNIWDGGQTHVAYQKAKVEVTKADLQLQKTKDSMNKQILAALEQFNTYKSNVASLEKAVSLAKRSFQLSQKRFQAGQTSITELNDTQSQLLQAEIQQATNLYEMNSTYALMESLIGKEI